MSKTTGSRKAGRKITAGRKQAFLKRAAQRPSEKSATAQQISFLRDLANQKNRRDLLPFLNELDREALSQLISQLTAMPDA
jgi:hypothetical protein